jgi:hypothetical protein
MTNYIIQTEGRNILDIFVTGNIVRIDTDNLNNVKELNDWNYEELQGHENVHYIKLLGIKENRKKNTLRHSTFRALQLLETDNKTFAVVKVSNQTQKKLNKTSKGLYITHNGNRYYIDDFGYYSLFNPVRNWKELSL